MECELSFNGQVVCTDGRRFVWRQGAWVQLWPPTGARAAGAAGPQPSGGYIPSRLVTGGGQQPDEEEEHQEGRAL